MRRERADVHTLAGAYAIDAVPAHDRKRFERHLTRCPACVQETADVREVAARLAGAVAAAPPPGLVTRAVAAAAQTPRLPSLAAAVRSRRRAVPQPAGRARAWPGLRAAAAAVAVVFLAASVALGLVARHAERQAAAAGLRSEQIATVLTAPDAVLLTARVRTGGTATVVMSHRMRVLAVSTAGLPPLPADRCYQLWLMAPGGDRSAGMLPVPHDGMTDPVVASGLRPGDRLGLTVEPDGGTALPTSAPILVVTL